jgi:glycosyltransferase involved in cell wall biosynthesis
VVRPTRRDSRLLRVLVVASPLTTGTGVDRFWQRLRGAVEESSEIDLVIASEHVRAGYVCIPKLKLAFKTAYWAWFKLPGLVKAGDFDLVISTISQADILTALAARKMKAQWAIFIAGQPFPVAGQTSTLKRLAWRGLWNWASRKAGGWLAVSVATAERYSPDPARTAVIYPVMPQQFALSDASPVVSVGYLGRLSEEKDPSLFAQIVTSSPPLDHAVFGDGPLMRELAEDYQTLNLRGFSESKAAFSQMDVLLLTSKSEGLPLVIVEAARAKVPVLAVDIGGVREAIDPTLWEIMLIPEVQRQDIALWRQRIEILREPSTRDVVLSTQSEWVQAHFASEIVAAKFESLVTDLVRAS